MWHKPGYIFKKHRPNIPNTQKKDQPLKKGTPPQKTIFSYSLPYSESISPNPHSTHSTHTSAYVPTQYPRAPRSTTPPQCPYWILCNYTRWPNLGNRVGVWVLWTFPQYPPTVPHHTYTCACEKTLYYMEPTTCELHVIKSSCTL